MPRPRKLNLRKKSKASEIEASTKRLYQCPTIFVFKNNGGPFPAGEGEKITVPRRMEVLLQACTRQLQLTQPCTTLFLAQTARRISSISELHDGMDVIASSGEKLVRPIGNKGHYVTSDRSILLAPPEWLDRHSLQKRGLTLLSILKKVIFTHSCSGSHNHIESQYCQVCLPNRAGTKRTLFAHYRMPDGTNCHILPGMGKQLVEAFEAALPQLGEAATTYAAVVSAMESVVGGGSLKVAELASEMAQSKHPVLLLDTSESMAGLSLHMLKQAVPAVLDSTLWSKETFNLVTSRRPDSSQPGQKYSEQMAPGGRDAVPGASDFVQGLRAEGRQDISWALSECMRVQEGDAVYFVSVGDFDRSHHAFISDVRAINAERIKKEKSALKVHTVTFKHVGAKAKHFLQDVAACTSASLTVLEQDPNEIELQEQGIDTLAIKKQHLDQFKRLLVEAEEATTEVEKVLKDLKQRLKAIAWGAKALQSVVEKDPNAEEQALIETLNEVFGVAKAPLSPVDRTPPPSPTPPEDQQPDAQGGEGKEDSVIQPALSRALREVFDLLDEGRRGFLTLNDLGGFFAILSDEWPESQARALKGLATAGSGKKVSFMGFNHVMISLMASIFDHLDTDQNNCLTAAQLQVVSNAVNKSHSTTMQAFGGTALGSVSRKDFRFFVAVHCFRGATRSSAKKALGALAYLRSLPSDYLSRPVALSPQYMYDTGSSASPLGSPAVKGFGNSPQPSTPLHFPVGDLPGSPRLVLSPDMRARHGWSVGRSTGRSTIGRSSPGASCQLPPPWESWNQQSLQELGIGCLY